MAKVDKEIVGGAMVGFVLIVIALCAGLLLWIGFIVVCVEAARQLGWLS